MRLYEFGASLILIKFLLIKTFRLLLHSWLYEVYQMEHWLYWPRISPCPGGVCLIHRFYCGWDDIVEDRGKSNNFLYTYLVLKLCQRCSFLSEYKTYVPFPYAFPKNVYFKLLSKLKLQWETSVWMTSWEPIGAWIFILWRMLIFFGTMILVS